MSWQVLITMVTSSTRPSDILARKLIFDTDHRKLATEVKQEMENMKNDSP